MLLTTHTLLQQHFHQYACPTFLDVVVAVNERLLSDALPVESQSYYNEVYDLYASKTRHEDLSKSLLLNSKREGT